MKKKTAAIIPIRSATEALYDAETEKDENIIGKRIARARKQKMGNGIFHPKRLPDDCHLHRPGD